ncbi:putative ribonuclease P [Helianthus annuus]|nr:putative ribonuclease P [Helianthus annuus]
MSGDGTKRLRTHVWHAKRFTMIKRWGFHLPLGLHGSGKGSRALFKWLHNGTTVVHDASYFSAVQLQGSQDSILSILSTVMSPFLSSEAENVLCWCYGYGYNLEVMGSKASQLLQKILHPVSRWTIVLPLSWVKAFWVPLVSLGARAIGLRERSWVACEAGIPNFPSDFPEYSSLMEAEAAAMDKEAALHPASVKTSSIPVPPPWNCVRLAF